MHNLGHPDATVPASLGPNEAYALLRRFCYYLVVEQPVLRSGETFSLAIDEPFYRLRHSPSQFDEHDLF